MRQSDVGTKYSIEYWGLQYGDWTWLETGAQDILTYTQAEDEAARRFPNDKTRIVEYVTTSRVVSPE